MSSIKPVVNPSLALITPGWPMASVPGSNPTADKELAEGTTQSGSTSASRQKALQQSSHSQDRVD
jgi:hypothetical protein